MLLTCPYLTLESFQNVFEINSKVKLKLGLNFSITVCESKFP